MSCAYLQVIPLSQKGVGLLYSPCQVFVTYGSFFNLVLKTQHICPVFLKRVGVCSTTLSATTQLHLDACYLYKNRKREVTGFTFKEGVASFCRIIQLLVLVLLLPSLLHVPAAA